MAKVLVFGAGGVGGAFGAAMAEAGHDVAFVARGSNLAALRERGLRVTGNRGEIFVPEVHATDDPASVGKRDLVLMTVKSYDLEPACEAARPCGGIVVTLQNGVDAAERVASALGDVAIAGTTGIVADLVEPGHVDVVSTYSRITFGEASGVWSERTEAVDAILRVGGWIESQPMTDVRVPLWEKMALICAMSGLTTLTGRTVGQLLSEPSDRSLWSSMIAETVRVARAGGVDLPSDVVTKRMEYSASIDRSATSSMARDFQRGRRLEVHHLQGAVVRLGRQRDVPARTVELVYEGLLKRLSVRDQESNDK